MASQQVILDTPSRNFKVVKDWDHDRIAAKKSSSWYEDGDLVDSHYQEDFWSLQFVHIISPLILLRVHQNVRTYVHELFYSVCWPVLWWHILTIKGRSANMNHRCLSWRHNLAQPQINRLIRPNAVRPSTVTRHRYVGRLILYRIPYTVYCGHVPPCTYYPVHSKSK